MDGQSAGREDGAIEDEISVSMIQYLTAKIRWTFRKAFPKLTEWNFLKRASGKSEQRRALKFWAECWPQAT